MGGGEGATSGVVGGAVYGAVPAVDVSPGPGAVGASGAAAAPGGDNGPGPGAVEPGEPAAATDGGVATEGPVAEGVTASGAFVPPAELGWYLSHAAYQSVVTSR
jgi:hypothetical protein